MSIAAAVARGGEGVAEGVALLPLVVLQNIATLGLLVFTAIGLIGTRQLLLDLSPTIAKHAKGFADALNFALDALQVFAILIHEVVGGIIEAIHKIMGKRGHLSRPQFVRDPVSAEEIRRTFTGLPARQDWLTGAFV